MKKKKKKEELAEVALKERDLKRQLKEDERQKREIEEIQKKRA